MVASDTESLCDVHAAAEVSSLGERIGTYSFPATAVGYRELLTWARGLGTVRRAVVEGTGSFGAALSRYLLAQQVEVFDVNWPDWSDRRRRGKSDAADAQLGPGGVERAGTRPGQVRRRAGAVRRMFKLAKGSAVKTRTQATNQLKAVLVTADPVLREELAGLNNRALVRTCARLADNDGDGGGGDVVLQATHVTLSLLAQRIEQLTGQIDEPNQRLTCLVERHAPQLLIPVGIGPDSAVTLLITMGDKPERLKNEASFAALCGVSPVEYSSGRRSSRRLNHEGDRQANAALHRIVFTRLRVDPRTQAYYERRTQEGKTRREIIRCLKRCAAREVFNLVRTVSTDPPL
ncbi:IS110 family transposase [Streptomyces mirabilis]|uniref:transposase n=1 Tax=Streptomyces mirabilis TaxID=68239 RepID=UPI00198B53C9|nr:transposase [Streptomyces mirabilis]GHD78208.1 IS110 family transposase [Streptomyces mirabilis]